MSELTRYKLLCLELEDKLNELMGEEKYFRWAKRTAKLLFDEEMKTGGFFK